MKADLREIARALGGEVRGNQVLAPGPGHSSKDRSLSIMLDPNAPDGFLTNSFAGDDPIICRDYFRAKCGTNGFAPNGKQRKNGEIRLSKAALATVKTAPPDDDKCLMPVPLDAREMPDRHHSLGKPSGHWTYNNAAGEMLFEIWRFDPPKKKKIFLPLSYWRRPSGLQEWDWEAVPAPRPLFMAWTGLQPALMLRCLSSRAKRLATPRRGYSRNMFA